MRHESISEDPDVRDTVAEFRDTVLEIRAASAQLFTLPPGSPHRAAIQERIEDLTGGIALRADRLAISLDRLLALVNADLAYNPPPAKCTISDRFLGALAIEIDDARRAEASCQAALRLAQSRLDSAEARRIAAERACAGYAAEFPL